MFYVVLSPLRHGGKRHGVGKVVKAEPDAMKLALDKGRVRRATEDEAREVGLSKPNDTKPTKPNDTKPNK